MNYQKFHPTWKLKKKNNKIKIFGILITAKSHVIKKRHMSNEIINEINIGGLQNFEKYSSFNPV